MFRIALGVAVIAALAPVAALAASPQAEGAAEGAAPSSVPTLTGTSRCTDTGQIRLRVRIAGDIEHDRAVLSGVRGKGWVGAVIPHVSYAVDGTLPPPDDGTSLSGGDPVTFVPHHGVAGVWAWSDAIRSVDSFAAFETKRDGRRVSCGLYVRGGAGAAQVEDGLAYLDLPASGTAVDVGGYGTAHHRYRVALSLHTKAGVHRRARIVTAGDNGLFRMTFARAAHLRGVSAASVRITDLDRHGLLVHALGIER